MERGDTRNKGEQGAQVMRQKGRPEASAGGLRPHKRRDLFEQPRVAGCSTQGMWSLLWKVPEAYGQIPSKELWEQILPADPKPARSPPPPAPAQGGWLQELGGRV